MVGEFKYSMNEIKKNLKNVFLKFKKKAVNLLYDKAMKRKHYS